MFKSLFDTQTRLAKIDKNGDPLKMLNELIDSLYNLSDDALGNRSWTGFPSCAS